MLASPILNDILAVTGHISNPHYSIGNGLARAHWRGMLGANFGIYRQFQISTRQEGRGMVDLVPHNENSGQLRKSGHTLQKSTGYCTPLGFRSQNSIRPCVMKLVKIFLKITLSRNLCNFSMGLK
jgi:hypothetical protein